MIRNERVRDEGEEPPADERLQASSGAVDRGDDRLYNSLLGLAMIGAEVVWLCAIVYAAYRLLT